MDLQPATQDILALLERATGLPVQVSAFPGLDTRAVVRMARGDVARHHVLFNPLVDEPPDYLICHQCGFIIRLFGSPAGSRVELASAPAGRAEVARMIAAPSGIAERFGINDARIASLAEKLYDGLVFQLRSVPVGLRVGLWLHERYPSLADQQGEAVRQVLERNLGVLDPEYQAMTPAKAYRVSVAMNAATAAFWANTWSDPDILAPYVGAGRASDGRALVQILDRIADHPAQDQALVDAWAEALGIAGWTSWQAYEAPSPTP